MKTSKEIINHIVSKPSMKKLSEHNCYLKLKSLLPKHLRDSILFMYRKNRTLFFVLNHPGIKMEFNYKVTLINSLLNKIKEVDKKCSDLEIENIKSFVSNRIHQNDSPSKKQTLPLYKERAKGEFKNLAKNEDIRKILEEIRKTIKNINLQQN